MGNELKINKHPEAEEKFMIAGWYQWADAGDISSGLPGYLIEQLEAEKIAEMDSGGFYLFQIPGTHQLVRPEIRLVEGYREFLSQRRNEFFYTGVKQRGLVIFLGHEPHLDMDRYSEMFLDAVEQLGVKRVAAIGGVYGPVPYNKDREISCIYSLPDLKDELNHYAVKFSDYEGGSTIGAYLVDKAEERGIEIIDFYAFVPAYEFAQSLAGIQGLQVERDFKAWYDLMRRFNYMFGTGISLSNLKRQSDELVDSIALKIEELEREMPELEIGEYLEKISQDFTELSFMPLDDVWERELKDILDDEEG